jgi:glycosyltransferase involved in cell wall biosynthesis
MSNHDNQKFSTLPKVSVIISIYNEENHIRNCILSIKKQNYSPLEIVIVDDGSNDDSITICEEFGSTILRQDHRGPGAARNLGARNSSGSIVVFVDGDMVFASDYIHNLVQPIINADAVATCHWNEQVANWENPWARCQTWFLGLPDKRRHPIIVPEYEMVYRAVQKDFFLASGGFSETEGRGDDTSISRRTGTRATVVKNAIAYHNNFESIEEIWIDSKWRGRHTVVLAESRFKRILSNMLFYKNFIFQILRGFYLAFRKKEPRLIPYSVVYAFGYHTGILYALITGQFIK